MELLIGVLALGVVGIVVFFFKISADDAKREKNIDSAKDKRLGEIETESKRKDSEMKKMMEERQKLEDEFFKTRDEIDILKKEHAEMSARFKQQEKAKDELADLKTEIKQKEALAHQETVARQKLQGEVSLKEIEVEKLKKEADVLRAELKTKSDALEGLRGQLAEVEAELQKAREGTLLKLSPEKKKPAPVPPAPLSAGEPPAKEGPEKIHKPTAERTVPAPPADGEKQKENEAAGFHPPGAGQGSPSASGPRERISDAAQEIPGISSPAAPKIRLAGGVPSDTDFLGSAPLGQKPPASKDAPETPFKFTKFTPPPKDADAETGKEKSGPANIHKPVPPPRDNPPHPSVP